MVSFAIIFAADERPTLWQRLDDATRGRLTLTLVAFVLLIALAIILIALSARMMRRIARHRPPDRAREESDWDRKQPGAGSASQTDDA
jgi:cell division protein FtsL